MFRGKTNSGMGTENFAVPLCLWQKAAFLSSSSGPLTGRTNSDTGGGREERDSLRLRITQLHHERWKEISKGNNPLHVQRLLQSLVEQYSTAMDCSEGMTSIMAPVKVLTSNHLKESQRWKSEMTLETLLAAVPGLKDRDRDEREDRLPLEAPLMVVDAPSTVSGMPAASQTAAIARPAMPSAPPVSNSSNHRSLCTGQSVPLSTHQTRKVAQFPYSSSAQTGLKGSGRDNCGSREVDEEEEEDEDGQTSSKWGGQRGLRGRRRKGKGGWDWVPRKKTKQEDDEDDVEDKTHTPAPFITARDQHILNQQKKYGGRRPPQSPSNGSSRLPHTTSYGCFKKSLGTRRAPGSKFVPPVRREEGEGGEGGRESCLDAVRSRVQYGGPSGGGTEAGRLPPELEGNERLKNIEPRMVELITNEIMDHSAPVQWEDIAGLQFAKATIKEIVVWPMLRPDIFTGLRGPPKGILLFGPPGTGKTLIGKCIASQVNATFFSISASSLTSKWIGEGEKMVRALFAVAQCYQPAVIFMDEIDSLLTQRSDSEHESSRRIKTEFLVQLDGATTSSDDRILVIGATNRPQEIDEAARRRLVKRLYIPLPDGPARKQIVSNLLREQAYSLAPEELEELSVSTDGYSGADMANLCREAAYGPVREAAETIQHIAADAMRPVLYKDFQAALHIIRPSVSEQDLELYVQWNKQFGCGKR